MSCLFLSKQRLSSLCIGLFFFIFCVFFLCIKGALVLILFISFTGAAPVLGVSVTAYVETPSGAIIPVMLADNGVGTYAYGYEYKCWFPVREGVCARLHVNFVLALVHECMYTINCARAYVCKMCASVYVI